MRLVIALFIFSSLLLLPGHSQAFTRHVYDGGYDELRVGRVRFNDTMTFPAGMATQVRRRYVLTGVERGWRYLVHLSHLGSPSIEYTIHVGRLRRSLLEGRPRPGERQPAPGQRRLADVIMLHVRTRADALRFDYIDGDGDVDNGDVVDEADDDDDYAPVVEIRGTRNAFPAQPDRWRVFSYNLRVEAMGGGDGINRLLVGHAALLGVSVAAAVLLVSRVIAAVAGDAPRPLRPRRDFLLFLLDRRGSTEKNKYRKHS